MEHYEKVHGRYVLYCDDMRVLETDAVAVLVDLRRGRIFTHGDPPSVRREIDRLRVLTHDMGAHAWVLLEGEPCVTLLNRALAATAVHVAWLHRAFLGDTDAQAMRLAREWIKRISRSPPT